MIDLRGAPVAAAITEDCEQKTQHLIAAGVTPMLAIVRVGAREDDLSYERGILKRFASAEAAAQVTELPADVTQEALEATIRELNANPAIHGILLFRPLPKHLSEERIKDILSPIKDIDCMTHRNAAAVFEGDAAGHPPCTPSAVMEILDFYNIELSGKRVAIVGRSLVVGKPLSMMLTGRNATVTLCHTRTVDLPGECRRADIVVVCAGRANMVNADYLSPGQTVIDVGINMVGDKLCGDVDYDSAKDIVAALTPVPGGVGAVTTAVLLKHVVANAASV